MKCNVVDGAIFKLYRKSKDVKILFLAKQTGVPGSVISDFENSKRVIKVENLIALYNAIGIEYVPSNESYDDLIQLIDRMIDELRYESKTRVTMDEVKQYEDKVRFNEGYFLFQYACLLTIVYHSEYCVQKVKKVHGAMKKQIISILDENMRFIPKKYQSLVYDTMGCACYGEQKWEESMLYYKHGLELACCDEDKAICLYHIGVQKSFNGEYYNGLELLKQSKRLMDDNLLYTRSLMCQMGIGLAYMHMGLYDEAEMLYLKCIRYTKNKVDLYDKLCSSCNNLLWMYISSKQYDKVIACEEEIMAIDSNNIDFLSCIGIAYYYQGNEGQAKYYLEKSIEDEGQTSKIDKALIDVFLTRLNRKRFREIDNKIRIAYDESIKGNELQMQIYILELQIENMLEFDKLDTIHEAYALLNEKLMLRK